MMQQIDSPSGAHMVVDGRTILNFGGCCYLGLSSEPELLEAAQFALRDQGPMGQLPRHYGFALGANLDAEAAAAQFFGTDVAMYFSAGYLFGLIALVGLVQMYDAIFIDEKAHYSLRDGAAASGKPIYEFKHRDDADLALVMKKNLQSGQIPLVATDGMFPTFGSIPPLGSYMRLLDPHAGWLIVDESHSFGIIGPTGRGAVEEYGLPRQRVVAGGSMGKAFCAFGGIAVGTKTAIDAMWKSPAARGAATGMSCGAAMTAASIRYVEQHPELLKKLRENTGRLKAGIRTMGIEIENTDAPVVTFAKGSAAEMIHLQQQLFDEGILVFYSTYVGAGPNGVIRCAVFADHTPEDIDRLLATFSRNLLSINS